MSVSVSQTEPGEFWTRGAEAGAQIYTPPEPHPQNGLHSLWPMSVSVYEACAVNNHTYSIMLHHIPHADVMVHVVLAGTSSVEIWYWCVRCFMFCCVLCSGLTVFEKKNVLAMIPKLYVS